MFLPTILNYLIDRERGRHYHFVGFERPPPQCPHPHDSKILYYLNDRDEGRYYFCKILAPPPPYATMLITMLINDRERGAQLFFVGFCPPPPNDPNSPPPDATILNYLNDRKRGGAIIIL